MKRRGFFSTLGVALSCLALTACKTTGDGPAFRPIGPDDAYIVLLSPSFPEANQLRMADSNGRNGNRVESLVASENGYWLEAYLWSSGPDYVWKTVKTHPREFLTDWLRFKDADFDIGKKEKIKTLSGFVDVWRVSSPNHECAAWNHYFDRRHGVDFYGSRLTGYFCAPPGLGLSDERVTRTMEGIGVRGSGMPLPAPRERPAPRELPGVAT